MKDYEVVAVLWNDHIEFSRTVVPKNPDDSIMPTLSFGIILKETDKVIVLVHDIERYEGEDNASFIIILKDAIVSVKKYGRIKIRQLRR